MVLGMAVFPPPPMLMVVGDNTATFVIGACHSIPNTLKEGRKENRREEI